MPDFPVPRFDQFYRHPELTRLLADYAAARPDLVALRSIGKSHEGRDIWLATLTNANTGADTDKPAFWVDGNIHAAELTASTACLYWLHHLVSHYGGSDEVGRQVTQLLDTRTVYIVPRLNPDGAELALADSAAAHPQRHAALSLRRAACRRPDGGRHRRRRTHAVDAHRRSARRLEEACAGAALLVPREPGDFGGEYFRVMPEGLLKNYDGLLIKTNPNLEGLDLNRNFPAYWRQEFEQPGAGPYPTSEPEVRAMVDFIVKHPNIGAAISFHTHSGVILRPMGTQSDDDMTPEDLWIYKRLSELGTQLTGYPAISIFHDFKYHPKEIITGTQDWVYEHLGALFWTVELWAPNREAGITDYDWIHWYREHPPEDDLKLLKWSDEQCGGLAHVDWYPFHHPQLGEVELGGWDKMNYWRNPPPALREREAARFPGWMTQIALSLPKLEVLRTEVRALGEDTWRVRFAVANAGYLPAYISKRALERKMARGVVFNIHLPPGLSLVSGVERIVGPQLEGHATKTSMQAFLPNPAHHRRPRRGRVDRARPARCAHSGSVPWPTVPARCAPRSRSTDAADC